MEKVTAKKIDLNAICSIELGELENALQKKIRRLSPFSLSSLKGEF
jgi:hypothetical protein